jgi:NAD-dependent SIR2 family protein deacetylase
MMTPTQASQFSYWQQQDFRWLVITGAGISVDSGIPTYRDRSGKWLRSDPITHQEFTQDESKRKRYWARSAVGWPAVAAAKPNIVHRQLAKIQQSGALIGVITQNVDRLHQRAGHRQVIDLHGRLDRVVCLACQSYEARESVQSRLLEANPYLRSIQAVNTPDGDAEVEDELTQKMQLVYCLTCQGTIMPDVVFYGGTVPKSTHIKTMQWFEQCDGVMVLGSSLMVYSSFRFCKLARQHAKQLVIVNQGVTRGDDLADTKLEMDCGEFLSA